MPSGEKLPWTRFAPAQTARLCSRALVTILLALAFGTGASAWIFPEHRDITALAINGLDPRHRVALDNLWVAATMWGGRRFGPLVEDGFRETIDFAAWPAIAGDHSCSPGELLSTVLNQSWIIEVARIGARLEEELARPDLPRHTRINALRKSDLDLLRADPGYASRAGANNVHFLLARTIGDGTAEAGTYLDLCTTPGAPLNAIGAFAWYHRQAMTMVRLSREAGLSDSTSSALALRALAAEAFAIHFLEDSFAAGHVAGTRGEAALRKGTHDFYNEHGLEARTWENRTVVLKGDAWIRPEDAARVAAVVRLSLEQFLAAAAGGPAPAGTPATADPPEIGLPGLEACSDSAMPAIMDFTLQRDALVAIVQTTPMPALSEGDGELPRFRGDLGPFLGIVPGVRTNISDGSFGAEQRDNSWSGGLDIAVRVGLGLDGVLGESGDGLVFLDFGFRQDAPSSTTVIRDGLLEEFGQIFSAVPSRNAITTRLRLPFWLLPLDLIATAPLLLPLDPESYETMAIIASNGGLVPWQSAFATSFGRFQFILGREMGLSLYGYAGKPDRMLLPFSDTAGQEMALVDLRSLGLEFPVVEYRPFRSHSADQASSLVIQLVTSVDIPTRVSVIVPDGMALESKAVWSVGIRAAFAWRYYW